MIKQPFTNRRKSNRPFTKEDTEMANERMKNIQHHWQLKLQWDVTTHPLKLKGLALPRAIDNAKELESLDNADTANLGKLLFL